ncbi:PEP-CTERM sorting domain-containing protein [Roseateles cellulosilyticus]|uniref:PEP-CTERM sorting domain-containing protein n=1 Tax=Pelomonas cellulosilytica TaxID=2906762 RepID=A0ABS8Y1Y4_9BURK|nr:PEP-CTERM sorting domain-containing protein [Pelomonas sp. P8]MCE4557071.1 PEP-CTERM sorting domain-containing protein [Pelomonas sp. P8]
MHHAGRLPRLVPTFQRPMNSPMNFKPLLVAIALAASSLAAQAATVSLTAAVPSKVGQGVDLLVSVSDPFAGLSPDEQLLSFGFGLSYDASRLAFAGFTVAAGWDDDSGWLGAGQFGGSSFPGMANHGQATLLLGTLHFDALQAGSTLVGVATDASNLNQGLSFLWSDTQPLTASLNLMTSAVPEPASLLMATLGLAAVGLTTRRRIGSK